MKHTLLTTSVAALSLGCVTDLATGATTLTNASYDTDSYIQFGTDNAFAPQISIGESQRPGSGHFTFGVIEFDVTTLVSTGNKFLELSSVEFITLTGGTMGPPTSTASPTGSATVQLVALNDSYTNYSSAADKLAWYDTHVQNAGVGVIGTYNFVNQSSVMVDVTNTVNGWINDASTNKGFALYSIAGNVELASSTYTVDGTLVPALVTVPEPASTMLLGLGGLGFLFRRRRL